MKKKIYLTFLAAIFATTLIANDYPVRTVNGEQFYEYTVQKSEGLFGVARKFKVSQADLIEANPVLETQSGLRLGQILLIPIKKEAKPTLENYKLHLVEPKQTLYSLAKLNDVTINDLIDLNPELKDGLKAGQTIKIPTKKTQIPAQIVVVDETEEVAKVMEQKPSDEAQKTEPTPTDSVVSANEYSPALPINPAFAETDSTAMKIALMLPLMSQTADLDNVSEKFLEFYKGVLIALANAKEQGISVKMEVFDTEKSVELVDSFLQTPFFADVDLIVGPAYANQAEKVLSFAHEKGIKTVIPFTSQLENSSENPFLFQFNPTFDEIFGKIGSELAEKIAERSAIIVTLGENDSKVNSFVKNLKLSFDEKEKPYREIFLTSETVDTLKTMASEQGTLLVLATRNVNKVAAFLPKIAQQNLPNLTVWGFEEWGEEWLSFVQKTYYYSLFKRSEALQNYENRYAEWFGKREQSVMPAYDLIGHDIVTYFLNAQNPTGNGKLLQSDIVFEQKEGEKKWTNLNYYTFVFDGKTLKILEK